MGPLETPLKTSYCSSSLTLETSQPESTVAAVLISDDDLNSAGSHWAIIMLARSANTSMEGRPWQHESSSDLPLQYGRVRP